MFVFIFLLFSFLPFCSSFSFANPGLSWKSYLSSDGFYSLNPQDSISWNVNLSYTFEGIPPCRSGWFVQEIPLAILPFNASFYGSWQNTQNPPNTINYKVNEVMSAFQYSAVQKQSVWSCSLVTPQSPAVEQCAFEYPTIEPNLNTMYEVMMSLTYFAVYDQTKDLWNTLVDTSGGWDNKDAEVTGSMVNASSAVSVFNAFNAQWCGFLNNLFQKEEKTKAFHCFGVAFSPTALLGPGIYTAASMAFGFMIHTGNVRIPYKLTFRKTKVYTNFTTIKSTIVAKSKGVATEAASYVKDGMDVSSRAVRCAQASDFLALISKRRRKRELELENNTNDDDDDDDKNKMNHNKKSKRRKRHLVESHRLTPLLVNGETGETEGLKKADEMSCLLMERVEMTKKVLKEVFGEEEAEPMFLFGSHVRGKSRSGKPDIDIAFNGTKWEKIMKQDKEGKVRYEWENLIESIPFQVHLVPLDGKYIKELKEEEEKEAKTGQVIERKTSEEKEQMGTQFLYLKKVDGRKLKTCEEKLQNAERQILSKGKWLENIESVKREMKKIEEQEQIKKEDEEYDGLSLEETVHLEPLSESRVFRKGKNKRALCSMPYDPSDCLTVPKATFSLVCRYNLGETYNFTLQGRGLPLLKITFGTNYSMLKSAYIDNAYKFFSNQVDSRTKDPLVNILAKRTSQEKTNDSTTNVDDAEGVAELMNAGAIQMGIVNVSTTNGLVTYSQTFQGNVTVKPKIYDWEVNETSITAVIADGKDMAITFKIGLTDASAPFVLDGSDLEELVSPSNGVFGFAQPVLLLEIKLPVGIGPRVSDPLMQEIGAAKKLPRQFAKYSGKAENPVFMMLAAKEQWIMKAADGQVELRFTGTIQPPLEESQTVGASIRVKSFVFPKETSLTNNEAQFSFKKTTAVNGGGEGGGEIDEIPIELLVGATVGGGCALLSMCMLLMIFIRRRNKRKMSRAGSQTAAGSSRRATSRVSRHSIPKNSRMSIEIVPRLSQRGAATTGGTVGTMESDLNERYGNMGMSAWMSTEQRLSERNDSGGMPKPLNNTTYDRTERPFLQEQYQQLMKIAGTEPSLQSDMFVGIYARMQTKTLGTGAEMGTATTVLQREKPEREATSAYVAFPSEEGGWTQKVDTKMLMDERAQSTYLPLPLGPAT